uniref:DUF7903 domain-containing protein n=1 Tax=Ananas comosus var. bracteatus TaxID=296719 RepID=A0A6V7Q081_ANACO|nr:unnamed protein product [Ananas comosus var. bracteatus]
MGKRRKQVNPMINRFLALPTGCDRDESESTGWLGLGLGLGLGFLRACSAHLLSHGIHPAPQAPLQGRRDAAPLPCLPPPRFQQSLTLASPHLHGRRRGDLSSSSSSSSSFQHGGGKIVYAAHCVSRWWLAGIVGGAGGSGGVPESLRLEPFPCEIVERRSGAKPLVVAAAADDGGMEEEEERPWVGIARRVEQNLVASARSAREELDAGDGNAKLSFVARVGKVLFHGDPSTCLNSIRKAAVAEEGFKNRVHKSFYTNVPNEFMKNVEQLIVKSIGFDFESEREHYHVKVFDKHQPDSTISCKCTVRKDGGLELYKIELNQVRHMVVDISCLHKDLDLRLMLVTKKLLKNLDDEVENGINQLISSAIIDSEVKGGFDGLLGRSPLLKDSA